MPATPRVALSPENRKLAIGLGGVLVLALAFVGSNVAANHKPEPHNLPIGAVGSARTAERLATELEALEPGGFDVTAYDSAAAAREAIRERRIYGAFEPGAPPTLLVASAASAVAEEVLLETFRPLTVGRGETLAVDDVVRLPPSDDTGATAFSAVLSLTIAAILGSSIIYITAGKRRLAVRLGAVLALGVGAGLMGAIATNVLVGAFPGRFAAVWLVATMFVLAIAFPVAAFQTLIGLPGTGLGLIAFVVVGTPSSGGATAPELLPGFWRAVSQLLPPGAGTTGMRDLVYFHGHGATRALIVLALYAILGAALTTVAYRAKQRPQQAP
ncbi:MAG TPA: hypothetical protein VFI03_09560 [Solirubrobacterales bacterium]|nr:hypothetical protein [Solirubrobacterales bacterium]